MIAAFIFIAFFLVIYLTRPNRKRRQSKYIKIQKLNPKPTLDQARQQAMTNFWVQALTQSIRQAQEKLKQTTSLVNSKTEIEKAEINSNQAHSDSESEISQIEIPSLTASDIIDVSPEIQRIDYDEEINENLVKYGPGIPHWDHHYVYRANEINYANPAQQAFYRNFKRAFLNDTYFDLEGNTNYGFILYFDLIEDYRQHKNLQKLELQFKKLEQVCDRISGYSNTFLFNEIKDLGKLGDLCQLDGAWSILRSDRPSYLNWDWKSLYEHKMKLSKEEVGLLEPIYLSSGAFMNIDFICRQFIRLYIEMVKSLKLTYSQSNTNTKKEFEVLLDLIAHKVNRYHLNSPNYKYVMSHDSMIYAYIQRYAESNLRAYYGYNRKLNVESYLDHPEVKAALQEKIISNLEPKLPELYARLEPIDETNESELNAISPSRWRNHIESAINSYIAEDPGPIETLVRLNQKNASRDVMLFEISRQLIPIDKSASLDYYFRHIVEAKNEGKVWKLPTAAMNKQLFKKPEESDRFYSFLNKYIQTPDPESAQEFAQSFFQIVRKKIKLDTVTIQKAEAMDTWTSERLSLYLSEDNDHTAAITIPEEINLRTPSKSKMDTKMIEADKTAILLPEAAIILLAAFKENNFEMSISEANRICKINGLMAGTLVNTINEACYDLLDENLIEKEITNYRIQREYFNQIIKE